MKVWLLGVMILLILFIRVSQAQAETKPLLTVYPNVSPLIKGQTVSLICKLPGGSGSYHWYKGGDLVHTASVDYYSITVDQSHSYSCCISNNEWSTTQSDKLTLIVREKLKAVVILQPDEEIFTGQKVTLTCEIPEDKHNEWIYRWYKDGVQISVENNKYSFTPEQSFSSTFTCSGNRKVDSQTSEISTAVKLTVSEKPKPELTSNRQENVLTGNILTLTCTLKTQSAGWKFYWIKPTQGTKIETDPEANYYTIYPVSISDGGQYKCRAGRGNPVYYTDYSDALWVKVIESPEALLTVKPDKYVFSGETVTFRCEIQGKGDTEWIYRWLKNVNYIAHTNQEFSLSHSGVKDSGKYICIGQKNSDNQSSKTSNDITLTVSDNKAEAVVTVSPLSWLNEGDSVTLSCEVKHSSTGWTFSWYIGSSLRYRTELLSDSSKGSEGSYTISSVTLRHTGVYLCRAARGEHFHTKYSTPKPLWITGTSPSMSLIINPSRTQHFTTKSFTLSCEDQSDSTGWVVRGYTHSEAFSDCSETSSTSCNIKFLSTSHTGVYWCQSESGGRSNPVNITVHDGQVILDSPVHPVPEGHSLTLRCSYRLKTSSESGVEFYKDGSVFRNNTTGEITIGSVSKSHEGFYHCKHPKKGESPKSLVLVSVQSPRFNLVIIAVAVGLSLALLLIIISFILLRRHKSNKGKDKGQHQNSNQSKGLSQSAAEDSRTEETPLQTDLPKASDVTYAELELKAHKKRGKRHKENQDLVKADAGSDTVYSVLKQNT